MAFFHSRSALPTRQRVVHGLILLALTGWLSAGHSQPFATPPSPPSAQGAATAPCPHECATPPAQMDFSPPPVPRFMLERPTRPLSLQEMVEQAKQAQERSQVPTQVVPADTRP